MFVKQPAQVAPDFRVGVLQLERASIRRFRLRRLRAEHLARVVEQGDVCRRPAHVFHRLRTRPVERLVLEVFEHTAGSQPQQPGRPEQVVQELRRRQPKGFRTLLSLLDPAWLKAQSKSDQTIVDTIVENGLVLQGLIREQSGAVDPALLPFLAKAGTHFTMLRLAREGALDNDRERFAPYVYPRELDEILRLETTRLRSRLEQLSDRPTARHPPLGPLIIPDALLTTMLGASPETIPPAADASHRAPIG